MNAIWGVRWKVGVEIQYYYRRLSIIKVIERFYVNDEIFILSEAAVRLEIVRLSVNISLNRFAMWCAEGEKKDDGVKNANSKRKRQA